MLIQGVLAHCSGGASTSAWYTMLVEIIAHRGASRERTENTLDAFLRAVELGAHAIELDVHATLDGHVVVHHDPVFGAAATPVARVTLADIEAFNADGAVRIPTLREVLEQVDSRIHLYVEVKGKGISHLVADLLAPHAGRCSIHSFDHRVSLQVRQRWPDLATGILSSSYVMDPVASLRAAGARDYWQHRELVDADLVRAVHRADGRLICWTENDPHEMRALVDMGVDGICTDVPDVALSALG
jgi:glycerophosphoryl diester phosphodiesterase